MTIEQVRDTAIAGLEEAKAQDIKDVGTVAQYRHLLEMGAASDDRSFRLAERLFFRLLSLTIW